MKATHLHVLTASVVVIGGLYAAFTSLTAPPLETAPKVAVSSRPPVLTSGGGQPAPAALPQDTAANGAITQLAADLSRLRTEVARLRDQVQHQSAMAAMTAVSGDEAPTGETPPRTEADMERLTQAREYEDQQRQATADAQFQAERVDRPWAAATTELLTQALGREDLTGTETVNMDCRTTTCRLTLSHTDAEAASQFDLVFPMQMADALPQTTYFRHPRADGRIDTVLYLVRKGYE